MIPCISAHSHSLNSSNKNRISPQLVAEEIAFLIQTSRCQGQTLDDLIAEILAEDPILDQDQRRWLSNIIIQAWKKLPSFEEKNKNHHLSLNYRDNSSPTTLAAS